MVVERENPWTHDRLLMPCRATEAEVSSGHAEPKSQVGATERRRGSQGPQGMPGVPSHDHPGSRPDVADQRRSLATRHTPNPTTFVDVASLAPTFRVQTHHSAAERERSLRLLSHEPRSDRRVVRRGRAPSGPVPRRFGRRLRRVAMAARAGRVARAAATTAMPLPRGQVRPARCR